jgi:hypothetical protein
MENQYTVLGQRAKRPHGAGRGGPVRLPHSLGRPGCAGGREHTDCGALAARGGGAKQGSRRRDSLRWYHGSEALVGRRSVVLQRRWGLR